MGLLSAIWGVAKPRVLTVDDDPLVRSLIKELLESQGYKVDMAEDGMFGLDAYKAGKYDLLILDCNMPRMSGVQLLEAIRAMPGGKEQAILMLSSEKLLAPIYKAYELGVIEWSGDQRHKVDVAAP